MNERDLFLAALEISDPAERAAYLQQACAENHELRNKIEQLLSAHEQTSQFLEVPAEVTDSALEQTMISGDADSSAQDLPAGLEELQAYLEPSNRHGWLGRLGHYEIEEILGRGAFGIVAKAFDEKLHRVVAIKLLSPELATTSPPRKRFLREARTAAAVMHENIVAIHAVEEEPIPYIVIEYIPGQTLQQRMNAIGPLETPDFLKLGRQIASGLAAAHAVNLIHRDIKPSNILLTEGPVERAKISDFGLARAVDDASMTSSGLIAGTPMYMAPEQARGETLDHRADLFSLGSVFYQMVSGRPPFRAANTIAVLKRVCEDRPRALDDVIPETPDWLQAIIFKLLEKDRDDRYQSAQEVADLLEQCEGELKLQGFVSCVPEADGFTKTSYLPRQKTKNKTGKNLIGWILGTIVCIPILLGLIWAASSSNQNTQEVVNSLPADQSTKVDSPEKGTGANTGLPNNVNNEGWHGWPADAPAPAIAPFDADQAKAHQEAWAKYLGVPVEYENSIGMKFRLIPPGEFLMGSTPKQFELAMQTVGQDISLKNRVESESPLHKVILSHPFFLSTTEVSEEHFEQVTGVPFKRDPNETSTSPGSQGEVLSTALPVVFTSWEEAHTFCQKLHQKESVWRDPTKSDSDIIEPNYRLPTEAEWEFACRAGTDTRFSTGDTEISLASQAWFGMNSKGHRRAIGTLNPNAFGIFDMHGNVWEWVEDTWDPDFYSIFENQIALNPVREHIDGFPKVVRGGYFDDFYSHCRSASRLAYSPDYSNYGLGFRVALSLNAVKDQLQQTKNKSTSSPTKEWHGWPADAPAPAIAPFDADQAKAHQEAWAKYLGVPVEYENSIGMKFRLIPPGEFLMGSTPEEIEAALAQAGEDQVWQEQVRSEAPQHRVMITQPFYMAMTEVTQKQYQILIETNPSQFSNTGERKSFVEGLDTSSHPVENVNWHDAMQACSKMSAIEQLNPMFAIQGQKYDPLSGNGYQLPSEAQWEYACRAGTTGGFSNGNEVEELISASWHGANSGNRTHEVGQLLSNPFGLYDLHGNVYEWVLDNWSPEFYAESVGSKAIDPLNPYWIDGRRICRGGSWHVANPILCFSAHRKTHIPSFKYYYTGFRLTLSVDAVKEKIQQKQEQSTAESTPGWPADAPAPANAPFDADQAKKHQEEWAKYLGVPVEKTVPLGTSRNGEEVMLKMTLIPPGEFLMGSSDADILKWMSQAQAAGDAWALERMQSEQPRHRVTITAPFWISTCEVTQEQFECFVTSAGYVTEMEKSEHGGLAMSRGQWIHDSQHVWNGKNGFESTVNHPVVNVTFHDAKAFCEWLNQDSVSAGFRLPTEAMWEYACRAGTNTTWSSGDNEDLLVNFGWHSANSMTQPHPTGRLQPNQFGLHDMFGNTWEWCDDWFSAGYYSVSHSLNPKGPESGTRRVLRGGGWGDPALHGRSAQRHDADSSYAISILGFRVVEEISHKHVNLGWHGWPADAPAPAIAPFDADQAKAHQEAWAKYLGVPVEYENSIGMKFRLIPPGEFLMGKTPSEVEAGVRSASDDRSWRERAQAEGPQHKVILTQPVYVSTTEVTQSQYEQVMESNPAYFSAGQEGGNLEK